MADLHTSFGIYIVVWFDLESWKDAKDTRHRRAAVHGSADELGALLEAKAAEMKETGRQVAVVVLDASLRRPVVTLAPGKASGTDESDLRDEAGEASGTCETN